VAGNPAADIVTAMQKTLPVPADLHVVTMVSNPRRFRSRYDLYRKFAVHMRDSGAKLHTVELALHERQFELKPEAGEEIIQLRTDSEIWHKENAIEIGLSRLPPDAGYVAWIDADVHFVRHDWVAETLHMLQHHPMVQCWSQAHDLNPDYEAFESYRSFAYCYQQNISRYPKQEVVPVLGSDGLPTMVIKGEIPVGPYGYMQYPAYWHSGYAWAARREALDALGGLIDFAVMGAADHHMALALVGRARESLPGQAFSYCPQYCKRILDWQQRAEVHIRRNIGYVPGTIEHHWHGKKTKRGYTERWEILTRNGFDPDHDLKYDMNGLHQLTGRKTRLRDDLMHYHQQRNEDGIDP
jgi:hypothetical protein